MEGILPSGSGKAENQPYRSKSILVEIADPIVTIVVAGDRRAGYGRLPMWRFEFIPMRDIKVFFLYAPRRVNRPTCGVRVERMPWSEGKRTKTMRSKSGTMKKVAHMLRRHRPLLMNWFKANGQFSSGIVEGSNNKAN